MKLSYINNDTGFKTVRKYELLQFRKLMGNMEKKAQADAMLEKNKTLNTELRNPEEIFSMNNFKTLNENEKQFKLTTNWMADAGVVDVPVRAPKDDVKLVQQANTNAQKLENRLDPNPALTAAQSTAQQYKDIRKRNDKIARDRQRYRRTPGI